MSRSGVGGEGVQLGCERGGKAARVAAGNGGLECERRNVIVMRTGRSEVDLRKMGGAPVIWLN